MKKFAKLFGPDTDQVLVTRRISETGEHQVRINFRPQDPEFYVCEITLGFGTRPGAEIAANLVFDRMTESDVRQMIANTEYVKP